MPSPSSAYHRSRNNAISRMPGATHAERAAALGFKEARQGRVLGDRDPCPARRKGSVPHAIPLAIAFWLPASAGHTTKAWPADGGRKKIFAAAE
jgi:hypothetical protein